MQFGHQVQMIAAKEIEQIMSHMQMQLPTTATGLVLKLIKKSTALSEALAQVHLF